ncbi:MAG: beta strand repeat-containing protein, partial [Clostridia bacterium]
NVKKLVSGFNINTRSCSDNIANVNNNVFGTIANYDNPVQSAKLYTYYDNDKIGMKLNIQATPVDAINSKVKVGFYDDITVNNGVINYGNNLNTVLQLFEAQGVSMEPNADGVFEIDFRNKNQVVFLSFNDQEITYEKIYMVCTAVGNPSSWKDNAVTPEYVTYIAEIDVVGAVSNTYLYKSASDYANATDTLDDYAIANIGVCNEAYLKFVSNHQNVKYDEIEISSENGYIKFSADKTNWFNSINVSELSKDALKSIFTLYFKTDRVCNDSIIISSPNIVSKKHNCEFVNIVKNENTLKVNYNSAYITELSDTNETSKYFKDNDGSIHSIGLSYLALQSGRTVQFRASGDNKNENITSIEAKSLLMSSDEYLNILINDRQTSLYQDAIDTFSQTAVKVDGVGDYFFDIKANSVGYTSIVFVKVNYYTIEDNKIEFRSKYFVYEIAVYNPARNLTVNADKESIVYINSDYPEVAIVNFNVGLNACTKHVYFSSDNINDKYNKTPYGEAGTGEIYSIKLELTNVEDDYFDYINVKSVEGDLYLDNATRSFSIKAIKSLNDFDYTSISCKVTIMQFGEEQITTSITKVIYIGEHVSADKVVILSGVDRYNNIYLSVVEGRNQAIVEAYATNDDENATYGELAYEIHSIDPVTGEVDDQKYIGSYLTVEPIEGTNQLKIKGQTVGGQYQIWLYPKDRDADYNIAEDSEKINITVSDGATEATAYLISNIDDFVKIKNEPTKYYRLSQDVNISALKEKGWSGGINFEGSLDGSMKIIEPNSGEVIYKRYSLIGLKVDSDYCLSDNDGKYFGLFTTNSGTIKNIVFTEVEIDITLNNVNTADGKTIAIGSVVAINNGTIENCSINIKGVEIILANGAQHGTYNIGLVAGINESTISYKNASMGSNYPHLVDMESGALFNIEIEAGNTKFNTDTKINIGGVVGNNAGEIKANYIDRKDSSISDKVAVVVNINVINGYTEIIEPNYAELNIGGVAGYNGADKKITNIAVSGRIIANDKANIGGIVGYNNQGIIKEVSNYGANIEGTILGGRADLNYKTGDNQEQNIGGIIGYNDAGTIDVARMMFIHFASGEISVSANETKIQGVGNVGGIIGKATSTTITRAYVENFVQSNTIEYNIIGTNGANVAGFIASGSGTANLSFVQANFRVDTGTFNHFGTSSRNYVYFVGYVRGVNPDAEVSGNVYIVRHVVDGSGNVTTETSNLENITMNTEDGSHGISIDINGDGTYDTFSVLWREDTEGVNDGYPYLVYIFDGKVKYTSTIRPTDIIVNVDETYFDNNASNYKKLETEPANWDSEYTNYYEFDGSDFEKVTGATAPEFDDADYYEYVVTRYEHYDEGIYLQYNDDNGTPAITTDDKIVATAIVYYVESGNNTYPLLTEGANKGLIEKTILPEGADGSYAVSIIEGSQIASITDGDNTITFRGVGTVVLRFVSLFDRQVKSDIIIFVENPIHDEVFNIATGSGLDNRNKDGINFATRVKTNSNITLSMKKVDEQQFDGSKTYMKYSIGTGTALVRDDTDPNDIKTKPETVTINSNWFNIQGITTSISGVTGAFSLGQFNLQMGDLDKSYSYLKVPVTLNVYLNLQLYSIGSKTLAELMGSTEVLIGSKTIYITIYNKATNLTTTASAKAQAGEMVTVETRLSTGYVNANGADGYVGYDIVGVRANELILTVEGQDTIKVELIAKNKNSRDLLQNAQRNNPNLTIWDLFEDELQVYGEKFNDCSGYTYKISMRLNEEYRYLNLDGYTDREWKFELKISATSDVTLSKTIEISFVPQNLISLRLENYTYLVAKSSSISEFISSETESSLIVPGESGLLKIFADYSYSYFDNVTITSSRQEIDGQQYFIRYQQMVYDKVNEVYKSYTGITADGETLNLRNVSYTDGSYDGVIFVRTILDEIVGIRKTFTMTVNATTYDLNGDEISISRDKTVLSQYKPGVYISVNDALTAEHDTNSDGQNEEVYLIEENSSITIIKARIFGYEFNVQPTITIAPLDASHNISDKVAVIQQGQIEKDASGAYVAEYRLSVATNYPFKVSMKMQLIDNGNTLTSNESELIFYPMPYIIKDMRVKGEANGGLTIPVNTSKILDLLFTTNNTTDAKVDRINTEIKGLGYLDLFYVEQLNASGQEQKRLLSSYLNATDEAFSITYASAEDKYIIRANKKIDPITVYFNAWYGFDLENKTVSFSKEKTELCKYPIAYQFRLILTIQTTEDAPDPISNASDLLAMADGENYILMEDITLENWAPLNTNIASLDGNGKVINIKSFNVAVNTETNVGLFGIVGENTILKNIVVNIGTMNNNAGNTTQSTIYIKDDNLAEAVINFGFIAGVNNGLIYNCEVVSISTAKKIVIETGSKYSLTFGGLVGINNNNITNSRVGTEYFEQITYQDGSLPSSVILRCGQIDFKAKGVMAGFVGQNSSNCVISSSFVANTGIENTMVGTSAVNRTAGFVATNNGTIAYSYVKGLERNILTTKSTTNSLTGGSEAKIYASGDGNVAGFAFYNSYIIHDCYSNTVCVSTSSGAAGFVYDSLNGSVYQCYSASRVDSGNTNLALATELPFVGVGLERENAKILLANSNMINCYYILDETEYDTNYDIPTGVIEPKGLSLSSFAVESNLNNFSFIVDGDASQQLNGVWTYSTAVDTNRSTYPLGLTSLPELTSANAISRSIRIFKSEDEINNDIKNYIYATGYEYGSSNNPFIIRSVDEYKAVFVEGASYDGTEEYFANYVRFIDNISFKNDKNEYINIDTRSGYVLGDKNEDNYTDATFTLIDGNGMTISDVVINHTENETGNLGLFSEVYNAVIKGLTIGYVYGNNGDVGSSKATCVGGVAGLAKNTYFIDINLTGGIVLRADNVVGGVVGLHTGAHSGLYNITSTISVQSGKEATNNRYSPSLADENIDTISLLSYAGGIVGIADIGRSGLSETLFNINRLTVTSADVRADHAGGVAGYLGENINAMRLTYTISNASQIFGNEVAGGIVADNRADIQLSQVSATDTTQVNYDSKFAEYIMTNKANASTGKDLIAIDNEDNSYGNLTAITGAGILGGFAGINYGGDISNSYTKANIGHTEIYGDGIDTAGGFIGIAYGGDLQYIYAQNYIELIHDAITEVATTTQYTKIFGGIIGSAGYVGVRDNDDRIGMDNVVGVTFFDDTQLNRITSNNLKSNTTPSVVDDALGYHTCIPSANDKILAIDYVLGCKADAGIEVVLYNNNNASGDNPIVHYGIKGTDAPADTDVVTNKMGTKAIDYNIQDLYYINTSGNTIVTTQQEVFNELFAVWPDLYWDKLYTKFVPTLKQDSSSDYIKITSPEDVKLLSQYPNRNFILVNDVEVTLDDQNYAVINEFSGVLIGSLITENGSTNQRFTRFNITINANSSRAGGAGFFKQTNGARIANIGFNYINLNLMGYDYSETIGGVSATDTDSRFEQITVTSGNNGLIRTITNATVSGAVGSIVGNGTRSNLIACTSNLNYDISVSASPKIGGLVGSLNGAKEYPPESGTYIADAMINSGTYTGSIMVEGEDNATIGGIVAEVTWTNISGITLGTYIENGTDTPVTITSNAKGNVYIGGIAGKSSNTTFGTSRLNLKVSDSQRDNDTATYHVGGIVAQVSNVNATPNCIHDINVELNVDILLPTTLIVGGAVANANTAKIDVCEGVEINNVLTEITIVSYANDDANTPNRAEGNANCPDHITIGGIIGLNSKVCQITNSMTIMECEIDYITSLIGGGLIGQSVKSSSYIIENSTAMGYVKANNKADVVNTQTLTILGGFVGVSASINGLNLVNETDITQKITNSYTTLTLSVAGVYQGDNSKSHIVYTNSIVGYTASTINCDKVLYSSDYTLTFDAYNSGAQNVTANVLLYLNLSFAKLNEGAERFVGSWFYQDGCLPVPQGVKDLLLKRNILTLNNNEVKFNDDNQGKCYYPMVWGDDSDDDKLQSGSDFKYYLLDEDKIITETQGDFTGVLLGNNHTITTSTNLYNTITPHSAISNVTVKLTSDSGEFNSSAGIVNTNNGTLFHIGVQYELSKINNFDFGALAKTNNGLVSYCYNVGNVDTAFDKHAGLVHTNEANGVIDNCYFTGSFAGGANSYALVHTNEGYISNTYSAGQAKHLFSDYDEGRYDNVKYDYFANHVLTGIYNTLDGLNIKGLTTAGLQESDTDPYKRADSTVFTGWKVYSMINLQRNEDGDIIPLDGNVYTTYNYGYPIHNINQLIYADGDV